MVIALPKGFRGGKISEEHQSIASVAPGEGFRIVRPLEPGETSFRFGYSLKSENGELTWEQDIKQTMIQAGMQIRLLDGMEIKPRGSQGRIATAPNGSKWFVLDSINIRAGQSMALQITGMPAAPEWRTWVPRLVGFLVMGLLVAGVALALLRKPQQATPALGSDKRRAALLDELVELERTGKDQARREQVLSELERLWRE
jgi:hypothetical protein